MFLLFAGLALAQEHLAPERAPLMERVDPMGPARLDSSEPALHTSLRMVEARWASLSARVRALPALPPGVPARGERLACTVRVRVDPRGVPESVTPLSCDSALEAPTLAAARRWRFAPAVEKGRVVAAETDLKAVAITK